jgi:hypothetical protein
MAKCANAWDPLAKGSFFGAAIWHGWARQALGILEPSDEDEGE